jgi:tRNA (guanine10-N2)-dimethyltransferase
VVAQTIKVQDIASYTLRDRSRPKRDSRVGMLPPKLAQIIINLAAGQLPTDKLANICDIPAGDVIPRPVLGLTVLDPFCGTGVVLQEAALMGYETYGTDIEQRMIDYTAANLAWLKQTYRLDIRATLEKGDATSHSWNQTTVDMVACESYLGRPFTTHPSDEVLNQTSSECNLIIKKFLRNIHGQLQSGSRLCVAVPAWQIRKHEFKHLPLLDSLEEIGYNRLSFEHAKTQDLLYYREDQIVARELLVLRRK